MGIEPNKIEDKAQKVAMKKVEVTPRRKSRRISNRESDVASTPKRRRPLYIESDSSDDELSLSSVKTIKNVEEKSKNDSIVTNDPSKLRKRGRLRKSADTKTKQTVTEKLSSSVTTKPNDNTAEKTQKVISKKTSIKDKKESQKLISNVSKSKEIKMTSKKFLTSTPVHVSKAVKENSMSGDLLGQILGDNQDVSSINKVVLEECKADDDTNSAAEKYALEKEIQHCAGKHYFYRLLSIGGIRLLVRGITHGYLFNGPTVGNSSYVSNVTIHTKLEYQSVLGFERITAHEACMEWLALKFAPSPSTVVRCRVNPLDGTLLMADVISNVNERNAAYLGCGFSQLRSNKLLLTILQKLSSPQNYPPASYILYHANTKKTVNVRRGVTDSLHKRVLYNLEQEYAKPGRFIPSSVQSLSWVPLDPDRQTPWQVRNNRVPLLFDINPDIKNGGNKNGGNEQQKKKRNKGKPKRRNQ